MGRDSSVEKHFPTVCFTDLDQGSQMNIFESILTAVIVSTVFRGTVAKNGLSLKSNRHKEILLA